MKQHKIMAEQLQLKRVKCSNASTIVSSRYFTIYTTRTMQIVRLVTLDCIGVHSSWTTATTSSLPQLRRSVHKWVLFYPNIDHIAASRSHGVLE